MFQTKKLSIVAAPTGHSKIVYIGVSTSARATRALARSALHILAPPLLAGNRKTCCDGQDLHELVRPPVTGLLRKRVLAKYQLHSLGKKGQNNRG